MRHFETSVRVLNSNRDQSEAINVVREQEVADIVRLLRILFADVEAAGPSGVQLTTGSAVFHIARQMLDASPEQRASTRTALMTLRDLVWRVDTVRSVLSSYSSEPAIGEALSWLDTSDIHLFLRQEP